MDQFRQHLTERVSKLTEQHENLKRLEQQNASNEQLSVAYNLLASTAWDTKCELENLLREYDRFCQFKASDLEKEMD